MRALIQRVKEAAVRIDGEIVGEIGPGLVVLLGVRTGDTEADVRFLADKVVNLRIFTDAQGKFNLSALEVGGEVLVVSQFTLYGECRKGRRPSFTEAAHPSISEPLYESFIEAVRRSELKVASGRFGADMQVSLINDGPVTVIAEARDGKGWDV